MTLNITLIFSLLIISVPVLAEADLSITLRKEVSVINAKVLLGDIAGVHGTDTSLVLMAKNLFLKPAPRAGYELKITKEFVERVIRKQKNGQEVRLNLTGAKWVKVNLQSEIVLAAEYLRLAELRLYQHLSGSHTNIELDSVGNYKPLHVPVGEIKLEAILNAKQNVSNRMKIMVAINSNGNQYAKIPVWFSVKAKAFVYKSSQHITSNTLITDSFLEYELIDIQDMKKDMVTDVANILNHKSNREINVGQVIRMKYLHKKLDVVAGQEVEVFYQSGGVSLLLKAQAIEGGNKGKKIKLRNNSSKELFEGIVFDKNKVKSI